MLTKDHDRNKQEQDEKEGEEKLEGDEPFHEHVEDLKGEES